MSSLISRSSILIISRLANQAILILSPIFLVRILDVNAYGQYREFILYSTLLLHFLALGISSNLLYFIPQCSEKQKENLYITHTALFLLISSSIGIVLIYLGKGLILANTSYNFILPLILFLFFSSNLAFMDSYWLGAHRPDYVLYYSTLHMLLRITALLTVAYFTRDVNLIVWSLVIVAVIRFSFVLLFSLHKKWFTSRVDFKVMKEQVVYFLPLGITTVLIYLNTHVSQLFISISLGVQLLAIYVIGSRQFPITEVVRTSVIDVTFPEVVKRNQKGVLEGLKLWQKTNVVFCAASFPLFTILFYYADIIITTLFTSVYSASIPIFRICLFLILVRAFGMKIPIRSMNKNKYFILGGIIKLVTNILLMATLFELLGLCGLALALVGSNLFETVYLAQKIIKLYKLEIRDLLMWGKVIKIAGCSLICLPLLFLGDLLEANEIVRASVFSVIYLLIFISIIYYLKIEEINMIFCRISRKIGWRYA